MAKQRKRTTKRTKQLKSAKVSEDQIVLNVLSSYVVLLAMFNIFISSLKKKLRLTDEDIKAIFSEPYSNFKDTLLADTVLRHTQKRTSDYLEDLFSVVNQIKEAQAEIKRLEDNDITLDTLAPDLASMERDFRNKVEDVRRLIDPLKTLFQNQEDIDNKFAANCDGIIKIISDSLKENGIKISSKKVGLSLVKMMNLIREQIALEDRIKRGEKISEEDTNKMQSIDTRCLRELLNIVKINNAKTTGVKGEK